MAHISDILTEDEEKCLREDFKELLDYGPDYDEVEDLLLSYGLEMDYLFDLI